MAHMGERRNMYGVLEGEPAGWRPFNDLSVAKRRILKWALKN